MSTSVDEPVVKSSPILCDLRQDRKYGHWSHPMRARMRKCCIHRRNRGSQGHKNSCNMEEVETMVKVNLFSKHHTVARLAVKVWHLEDWYLRLGRGHHTEERWQWGITQWKWTWPCSFSPHSVYHLGSEWVFSPKDWGATWGLIFSDYFKKEEFPFSVFAF